MSTEENIEDMLDDKHGFKEEIEYAGIGHRLGAGLIDGLVMIPIFVLSYFNQFNIKSLVLLYVLTLISVLYKPLLEFKYGATLGKMALGITVVNLEMKRITLDQSFLRYMPWAISVIIQLMLGTILYQSPSFASADTYLDIQTITQDSPLNMVSLVYSIIFFIAILWLVFDKKNQGLHDKIAKTYCIKTPK